MHGSETFASNQSTEYIRKSVFNLDSHLENIDHKIAVLDMQSKGFQSEVKPDNFPPVDVIGKLEERIKVVEEQNEKMLERMSDMTCQIITNKYGNDEYMNEEMQKMKNYVVNFIKKNW